MILLLPSTGPPLVAGTTAALSVLFNGNVDFLPSALPNPVPVVITVRAQPTSAMPATLYQLYGALCRAALLLDAVTLCPGAK